MPSQRSPWERGYRNVTLPPKVYDRLKATGNSPSQAIGKLFSLVDQLQAEVADLRISIDELRRQVEKASAPFDVEAAILYTKLNGTKHAQLLREYVEGV